MKYNIHIVCIVVKKLSDMGISPYNNNYITKFDELYKEMISNE